MGAHTSGQNVHSCCFTALSSISESCVVLYSLVYNVLVLPFCALNCLIAHELIWCLPYNVLVDLKIRMWMKLWYYNASKLRGLSHRSGFLYKPAPWCFKLFQRLNCIHLGDVSYILHPAHLPYFHLSTALSSIVHWQLIHTHESVKCAFCCQASLFICPHNTRKQCANVYVWRVFYFIDQVQANNGFLVLYFATLRNLCL